MSAFTARHAPTLQLTRGSPRGTLTTPTELNGMFESAQMLFFKAETGNAFTILRAGFALTTTALPKTSLFPALVAGFMRVLILQRPGNVKIPFFFTSAVPTSAMLEKIFVTTPFFSSHLPATASARAPLLIATALDFMAGAIAEPSSRNWDGRGGKSRQ